MRTLSLGAATALATLAASVLFPLATSSQVRRERFEVERVASRDVVAREVLLKLRAPLPAAQLAPLASTLDAETVELLSRAGIVRVRSRSMGAAALLRALASRPEVAYAEPNFVVRTFADPNDPLFPYLWGLNTIRATATWDTTFGSASNVVAVIDTGIDYTHPDIAPNIWSAPTAFTVKIAGTPITCPPGTHGFNAILRTCNPMDDHNHGTHVAGTIAAAGNNNIGVTGVNWVSSVMGLKFLDASGSGTIADAIAAVEFVIQTKQAFAATGGANVRILSNSWGGGDFSQAFLDQIHAANTQDMLFVAAAGNSAFSNDLLPTYPASYKAPNVVAVAATTSTDALAFFSNYGAQSVHLGAPGSDIVSTTRGTGYGIMSGTSMATPHVSGAGALVLSQCLLDTAQLKSVLLDAIDPIPSLATTTITGGRLNVNKAAQSCSAPPAVPANLKALGGDRQVKLTWSSAAGATSYRISRSTTTGGPYTPVASDVKGEQYVDNGLMNGTTYYYVVSAVNLLGESRWSAEASATPKVPPDLVITSLLSPANAAANSPIAVTVTTDNQGAGTADPSTTRFYISTNTIVDAGDVRIEQARPVPILAPGGADTATLTVLIPPGVAPNLYFLLAAADADDMQFESQEGNNTRIRSTAIGPDLLIATLTAPAAAAPGAPITANYTVRNQGGAEAPASQVRFYWSANALLDPADTLLASAHITGIGPETSRAEEITLTIPANAAVGAYYLIAEADAAKVVLECRETNNTTARSIHIGGDLVVSTLGAPAALAAGAQFAASDTTKNQGSLDTAGSFTYFYLSTDPVLSTGDTLLGTRRVDPLAPGQVSTGSTTLTLPSGTIAGSYYLFAKADGGNSVAETQEANNMISRAVAVGPDLTASVTSYPWRIQVGSVILVGDVVSNGGAAEAGQSTLRYYLSTNAVLDASDVQLQGARSIPSLTGGTSSAGSTSLTVPANTMPGGYYLIAKADADNGVVESWETNNTQARFIQVQ